MTFEASWISALIGACGMAGVLIVGWHKLTSMAESTKKTADRIESALENYVKRPDIVSIATEAANKVGEAAAKDLSEFKLKAAEKYVDRETYNLGIEANSRKLDNLTAKLDRILEWLFTGNLPDAGNPPPPTPPRPRRTSAS